MTYLKAIDRPWKRGDECRYAVEVRRHVALFPGAVDRKFPTGNC